MRVSVIESTKWSASLGVFRPCNCEAAQTPGDPYMRFHTWASYRFLYDTCFFSF